MFKFMTCCPSEKPNDAKITQLIAATLGCTNISPTDSTMDFLHFIRYMNVVYKADANLRLQFLYGLSVEGEIYCLRKYLNYFSIDFFNFLRKTKTS